MSTFGSDYKKNDLYDSIQEFFKQGGSVKDMLDVLHVSFQWGDTEIDRLLTKIRELEAEVQEANENATWWHNRYNAVKKQLDELKGESDE